MNKDNLIESIIADAKKQELKILNNAKKTAGEKSKSIIAESKKQADEIIKQAEKQSKIIEKQKLFKNQQQAKKITLFGQRQLIGKLFSELIEDAKNIKGKDREEILKNFINIAQNQIKDIEIIYTSKIDVDAIKKSNSIKIKAREDIEFGIVAISKDQNQCIDLSLDNLAEFLEKKIVAEIKT